MERHRLEMHLMGCGDQITINITPSGGRIVWGNTPLGLFTYETDAAGNLIRHKMQPRDPEPAPGSNDGPNSKPSNGL